MNDWTPLWEGYDDRRAAREAADHRRPIVGTYKVVEAIDYLRRATPAAVFELAADRWRKGKRLRRRRRRQLPHQGKTKELKCSARAAAATLLDADDDKAEESDDSDYDDDEADKGPDWLTHEALAAAANQTRPSAPGWSFLPLAVTQPRPAPGKTPKPGERPELEVRLTLVRKRAPSAPDFAKQPPAALRGADAAEGGAAAVMQSMRGVGVPGVGAYDANYTLTEPASAAAGFSKLDRGLGEGVLEESEEENDGARTILVPPAQPQQGDVLDIDPAAAFAAAVARRAAKGAHVDLGRMTNPRVDDVKRLEARAVATAGLNTAGGWGALLGLSDDHRGGDRDHGGEGSGGGDDASSVVNAVMAAAAAKAALNAQPLTAADKLGDPDADRHTRRRVEGGVDYATMTYRLSENEETGRVSLELLSARLGPGAYDPEDETTTVGVRVFVYKSHKAPSAADPVMALLDSGTYVVSYDPSLLHGFQFYFFKFVLSKMYNSFFF